MEILFRVTKYWGCRFGEREKRYSIGSISVYYVGFFTYLLEVYRPCIEHRNIGEPDCLGVRVNIAHYFTDAQLGTFAGGFEKTLAVQT